MKLFGKELSKKKRIENATEALNKCMNNPQDIMTFFMDVMQRSGIREEAIREISKTALNCVLPTGRYPIPSDQAVAVLPFSLCILRKMEMKALGLVRNLNSLNNLEIYLKEIVKAQEKLVENIRCLSIIINGNEYLFFLMKQNDIMDVENIPDSIIVIAEKKFEKKAGFDKYFRPLSEADQSRAY